MDKGQRRALCAAMVLGMSRLASGAEPEPSAADRGAADRGAADRALATQLFREGRALLERGKVSEACRKLEESQRLDPGGGTLLNLAICHETEGRTATAWAEFTEALGMAKRDGRQPRRDLAEAHISALEKVIPYVVVVVPKEADVPGLEIRRDGSEIRRAAWGSLIPVDPGEHSIEAFASGRQPYTKTVTVRAGQGTTQIQIPVLRERPAAADPATIPSGQDAASASSAIPVVASVEAPVAHPVDVPRSTGGAGGRGAGWGGSGVGWGGSGVGWVASGLGLSAVAVGSYFGLAAMSDKRRSDEHCAGGCDQRGAELSHDAGVKADVATIAFAVGLLGLGAGAYFLFARSSADSTSTGASPTSPATAPSLSRGRAARDEPWPRSVRVVPAAGLTQAGISIAGDW